MKIILSFDYELFFGIESGTPEKSIIDPVEALTSIADNFSVPLCFFVDAGYLNAMKRLMVNSAILRKHDAMIRDNLDTLSARRHEISLHVHPHWEDTVWRDGQWHFDLTRYCLRDFDPSQVRDIVTRYSNELRHHIPGGRLHAYRAGGWAVQPFQAIGDALRKNGIRIDSSVFHGGIDTSRATGVDFTMAPRKPWWRFEIDPTVEDNNGHFLELPTTSIAVSPTYYWKLALSRAAANPDIKGFGDGEVRSSLTYDDDIRNIKKLFMSSIYCLTLDGMKAHLAVAEYRKARHRGAELLVMLSHPKMIAPTSLRCMQELLEEIDRNGDEVIRYQDFDAPN